MKQEGCSVWLAAGNRGNVNSSTGHVNGGREPVMQGRPFTSKKIGNIYTGKKTSSGALNIR